MKYMGSKNRHAKDILPFFCVEESSTYVEPFVGGANLIDKVPSQNRIGGDIDEDLMCLWQAVSDGWMPPEEFTEKEYHDIKHAPTSPLKGYAAYALSYGGKKFGGWRRDKKGVRDYVAEAYRNAVRQFPLLRGVSFIQTSYENLDIPDKSIVYCDPPYLGTSSYSHYIDTKKFWDWVRYLSKRNTVFISEYCAPDDFVPIWEKPVSNSLTKDTGSKKGIEKLYVLGF